MLLPCTLMQYMQHIWRHVSQTDGNVLRLHLPELRQLALSWHHWQPGMLDDEAFRQTSKLEDLSVSTAMLGEPTALTLAPRCFARLTGLKDLTLANCGLTGVPSAVGALSDSLTSLSLEGNYDLELGEADVNMLLRLRRLRQLDVCKDDCDDEDHRWNNSSIQALIDLPGRWVAQHGSCPKVVFAC